ncbi:hypothetical protein Scep_027463 [Stephania cephalantha]|uniref:Uncharacterized protein n=1 Tax=Stephania cephalantha TaxID=152367 RepID=A0AAP0HL40_9MAGN
MAERGGEMARVSPLPSKPVGVGSQPQRLKRKKKLKQSRCTVSRKEEEEGVPGLATPRESGRVNPDPPQ